MRVMMAIQDLSYSWRLQLTTVSRLCSLALRHEFLSMDVLYGCAQTSVERTWIPGDTLYMMIVTVLVLLAEPPSIMKELKGYGMMSTGLFLEITFHNLKRLAYLIFLMRWYILSALWLFFSNLQMHWFILRSME